VSRAKIEQLSERQKELLTLIISGTSASKALARITGLTPASIDTMLSNAARILGARDRTEAARLFQEAVLKSQTRSQLRSGRFPDRVKSAVYVGVSAVWSAVRRLARLSLMLLTGPPLGGKKHQLRWDQVTWNVFQVALIGITALTALALLVLGFFETFGRTNH
jgi:DNA-binding CsgD family transcriptional regulator